MNKTVVGIIAGLALGAGATWLALRHPGGAEPAKAEAPAEKPKEKENPLKLNAAKRAAAGITLAKPTSATIAPEVNAFGRVLDPAPFIALTAELETAKASLAASEKSAVRAKELFSAGTNVSAQSVETADAAVARDRAALASARARLLAGWGRKLADDASLALTVAALEKGAALARVDLPAGDAPAAGLKKIRVGLAGGTELVEAEVLGPAPVADPQLQGTGFLVVLHEQAPPAGAALRAVLAGPGEVTNALVVPRSAVVYHQGSAWVFVLEEEDTFERKLVTLGRSAGDKVTILSGLEDPDHQVVITGAGQLLSAELQAGGAPEP